MNRRANVSDELHIQSIAACGCQFRCYDKAEQTLQLFSEQQRCFSAAKITNGGLQRWYRNEKASTSIHITMIVLDSILKCLVMTNMSHIVLLFCHKYLFICFHITRALLVLNVLTHLPLSHKTLPPRWDTVDGDLTHRFGTTWPPVLRRVFRCIFVNDKFCILIKISPKFVPKCPIDNTPAQV